VIAEANDPATVNTILGMKPAPKRKSRLNATELARSKFKVLFAAHDAKDVQTLAER
jgi:hypothetical protein